MAIKRTKGRPQKVDYKIMTKLADALQHSATVSDACRHGGISRQTYYHYMNHEPVFAEMMHTAKSDQYKLRFNLTLF